MGSWLTGVCWRCVFTCGWHSYSSMRLIHSESIPHGLSSVALQLQRGISDRSAVKICTFPIGRFTWKSQRHGRVTKYNGLLSSSRAHWPDWTDFSDSQVKACLCALNPKVKLWFNIKVCDVNRHHSFAFEETLHTAAFRTKQRPWIMEILLPDLDMFVRRGLPVVLSVFLQLPKLLLSLQLPKPHGRLLQSWRGRRTPGEDESLLKHYTEGETNFTWGSGYLSCRWHRRLSPSFLCCWRPRPCKGRPWPGRSTGNRWSQRSERETPRHRVSSAGCSLGWSWDGWPPLATTFKTVRKKHFRNRTVVEFNLHRVMCSPDCKVNNCLFLSKMLLMISAFNMSITATFIVLM